MTVWSQFDSNKVQILFSYSEDDGVTWKPQELIYTKQYSYGYGFTDDIQYCQVTSNRPGNWLAAWYTPYPMEPYFDTGPEVFVAYADTTPPLTEKVDFIYATTKDPFVNNNETTCCWEKFYDPESGIDHHMVALGTPENPGIPGDPEKYLRFTKCGEGITCTEPSPFEMCFNPYEHKDPVTGDPLTLHEGEYLISVYAVNPLGLKSDVVTDRLVVEMSSPDPNGA